MIQEQILGFSPPRPHQTRQSILCEFSGELELYKRAFRPQCFRLFEPIPRKKKSIYDDLLNRKEVAVKVYIKAQNSTSRYDIPFRP